MLTVRCADYSGQNT